MTELEITRLAQEAAAEKKAHDVMALQVDQLTPLMDYMLICHGTSVPQVKAIADGIEKKLLEVGIAVRHIEGYREGRWVLLDYNGLVIHVFHEQEREFYALERLWGDAVTLDAAAVVR